MNRKYTRAYLERNRAHWAEHGFGLRLFRHKQDGKFVGFGGLRRSRLAGREEISLGYAVCSDYWNRGLATEMVRAILTEGFSRLAFHQTVAITYPDNIGSRRVLEKSGFHYESSIIHDGLRHVLYRICHPTLGG